MPTNFSTQEIKSEKIFNIIDSKAVTDNVNDKIRPISISLVQNTDTINEDQKTNLTLSVYWNDTWTELFTINADNRLREDYTEFITLAEKIDKEITQEQYKDAEQNSDELISKLDLLNKKYSATPTNRIDAEKNDILKVLASKNQLLAKFNPKFIEFKLAKFNKLDKALDIKTASQWFSINKKNHNFDNYDFYYHSPKLFEKQAYMTVIRNGKNLGSYKVNYNDYQKFASLLDITPSKLGYHKDIRSGFIKVAEVTMQNIFFDNVDEAMKWQKMIEEKDKAKAEEELNPEENIQNDTLIEETFNEEDKKMDMQDLGGPSIEEDESEESAAPSEMELPGASKQNKNLSKEANMEEIDENKNIPADLETKIYLNSNKDITNDNEKIIGIGDIVTIDPNKLINMNLSVDPELLGKNLIVTDKKDNELELDDSASISLPTFVPVSIVVLPNTEIPVEKYIVTDNDNNMTTILSNDIENIKDAFKNNYSIKKVASLELTDKDKELIKNVVNTINTTNENAFITRNELIESLNYEGMDYKDFYAKENLIYDFIINELDQDIEVEACNKTSAKPFYELAQEDKKDLVELEEDAVNQEKKDKGDFPKTPINAD